MAQTPEVLQKRFAIPADLGTVAMPRIVHAFTGTQPGDQRRWLQSFYPAVASGALAFEGQHRATVRGIRQGVTQATIAAHAGTRRETVTRRISRLAAPAAGSSPEARREKALKIRRDALVQLEMHGERCACIEAGTLCHEAEFLTKIAGGQVKNLEEYVPPVPTPVINRRRRFGMANRYSLQMALRNEMYLLLDISDPTTPHEIKRFFSAEKAGKACERLTAKAIERGSSATYLVEVIEIDPTRPQYPAIEELIDAQQNPERAEWWNAKFTALGFSDMSRWIFDPRLRDPDTGRPLGTIERLVMACYEDKGLLDEMRAHDGSVSSPKGLLEIKQKKVAKYLGISTRTLWRCNGKWERLGVLRIVSGEPKLTESGYRRGPMKVLYLPFRMLTDAEAAIEAARMEAAVRRIIAREGAQRLIQLLEAKRLHGELLAAWQGREHCLGAFWKEARRQLDTARIFPDLIDKLIPPLHPQPKPTPPRKA